MEGLEETTDLVWRYCGPSVGDGERRFCGARGEPDLDISAGDVVTKGVVDEVRHQPEHEAGVPGHLCTIELRPPAPSSKSSCYPADEMVLSRRAR
jgi:hypothetical protein